ncbi:hypothetical protein [Sinomicrobium sp.]
MKKIILPIVALAIVSCQNTTKQNKEQQQSEQEHSTEPEMKIMIPQSNCLEAVSGKDSIWLKIEVFPNVAIGSLNYNFFEKDDSQGTLEGEIVDQTFYADYTYVSEGVQSVREVAFLLKDSTATEGYGEMVEKDGKMVFKDRSKIDFSKGLEFSPVDCVER